MNRRHFFAFGILAASLFAGCDRTTEPRPSGSVAMTTVDIHIDGFKKSKSGAT